jgi:hypothetical protein
MLNVSRNGSGKDRPLSRTRRAKQKRQYAIESLESRTLLSFTFNYTSVNGPQTVNETGGGDSFTVVNDGFGHLEWSPDPTTTPFSTQWGPSAGDLLNASPAVTLTINQTGDNADVILGASSPATASASAVQAHIVINPNPGLNGSTLTMDDTESPLGDGTYTLTTSGIASTITGPLNDINVVTNLGMEGGATLLGSNADNIFNMTAVAPFQSMSVVGGPGDDTVNAGAAGSVGGILAPLSVTDPTGTATLNVDDSADTTSSTATLSGTTPYELTGLSIGAIEYGAGVTALNILGGTFGGDGVTFDINNTQAITTTTITGGANPNFFNLSNAAESGGLDNLPGPVVINGGNIADTVTLDDSSTDFNDTYTITATTVNRTVFGGLTYSGIGTLTLNAENTLNSTPLTGNNTININSTADSVTTNVDGQGGNDTINVNNTGILGILNVVTGLDGSTVNVVADNQPVNVTLNDGDIVNIGSTGGAGTMEGILGAINITDTPDFYTLTFHDENDTTGHTWTLDNDDTVGLFGTASVGLSDGIATTTYQPGDLNSPFTINGGSGGNTFIVNNTTSNVETDLNTGNGADTVDVFATGTDTLSINGQDGLDTVTLGALAGTGMQNLGGTINVTNTNDFTALTLDDSDDFIGQTVLMSDDTVTGSVTGLALATINYTDFDISSLHILGGSGGNSFTVAGTLTNADFPSTLTTLNKGSGGPNTVDVNATSAGSQLDLVGSGGPDSVTIGNGSQSTILGPVDVNEAPGSTSMIIDLSNDGLPHNLDLSSDGTTGTLSDTLGNLPHNITYNVAALNSLEIDTDPTQDETLNLSFAGGGNPIPVGGLPGLIFNAGDPVSGVTHALRISGELPSGPFASETHNANDQTVFPQVGQYGSIFFTEAPPDQGVAGPQTSLDYTGLQPITDTAPATLYTFNDFGFPDQSFSATVPGTLLPGSLEFANIPTPATPLNFETTDVLNKINVVFNTPTPVSGQPGNGAFGLVNIPTASAGLATLTFNVSTGNDNTVDFVATPAAVVTTLNGSTASDITNVLGTGVAAGTTLTLNGGANPDVLNYDAGGLEPTVTDIAPGEVAISVPGAGIVDAFFYNTINIVDVAPVAPVPGTPIVVNSVAGFNLVYALVGTFTFPLPAGVTQNPPASDFSATIDWGDGSPPTAGVITLGANGTYDVMGTHTYANPGLFPTSLSISFNGGTVTIPAVTGVPATPAVGITLPAVTATSTSSTSVTDATLAVTAFPIVGTEGIVIPSGPIASFIDASGAHPVGDYTASISITNSGGISTLIGGATIVQVGSSAQYNVIAPNITLPEEGTYKVVVTVTATVGLDVQSALGTSVAVIADAPLTAGAPVALTPNTGVALPAATVVGTFTDANTAATIADFTAIIDWGDGTPNSLGTIVSTGGGGFSVEGGHIYAHPGNFATIINVTDDGGSTVRLTGTVTVTDLPVTGSTMSFTTTEGADTGLFVLATFDDPNTLATVAALNARLAIGGWGDGSPTTAGVNLVVQAIGFDPANGEPMFEVLGRHVYQEETPAGLPDTLSVIITTLGGATTTLTSPPGGGVTVIDAALNSSNGTTITGIEGISTGTVVLGTFHDANPFAPVADFTATLPIGGWGDGLPHAPVTLTITKLSPATPGGTADSVFEITGSHIYAEEGTFAITINVTDDGGSTTVISDTAIIADAALVAPAQSPISTTEAALFPVPVFAPPVFSGAVATFTDLNPAAPATDFTATIDWGDGTSPTAGLITESGPVGSEVFTVSGSHTYANSPSNGGTGNETISVIVVDDGGSRLTITNIAHVADIPIILTGILNPASDSGLSTGTIDTTNVVQPDFFGSSEPLSKVSLFATPVSGGTAVPIGTVTTGADGSWNLVSTVALADGHYTITATAIDQFGVTTTVSPTVITSNLLIDTTGPTIAGMFFNRLNGEVDFTIKDLGAAPSGVWLSTLLDSSNYLLTKVHATKAYPGKWIVTDVSTTAGPVAGSYDVAVVFNSGKEIRGGFYLFTIRDSTNGAASVQDLAENHLDGEFYGTFPSGNGIRGGDFVAELSGYHNKIFVPQTIIGTANPKNGGVGGPPVGAVHSGSFLPIVPRGGGSVFGTDPKHLKGTDVKAAKKPVKQVVKVKHVVKVKTVSNPVVAHVSAKASLHDLALMALVDLTKTAKKK